MRPSRFLSFIFFVFVFALLPTTQAQQQQQMVEDDELSATKGYAEKMQPFQGTWESFWANQAIILELTIELGHLSTADAARFRNDPNAWEEEMRTLWDALYTGPDIISTTAGHEL
mmetsp:Transcript_11385/g.18855  ORF Transcript_11385/g.18855 Transcript_11385/m.18855 type:complete len:115 (+) Transcript_11385:152-496(+)|eukprot:CAMPEP_0119018036 /NCGR_PEP_ID=MMETSP1176-20130426/18401_1 /TAXON_ID=265551 /ORGANISM="Synedropsis recta cf, Strain CCMP1620" /LENGTH=114 /DNA_ID=CAMNT_0006971935 /DNA_START=141 /DNA_END=485 /DNA_ORIENTATION=-